MSTKYAEIFAALCAPFEPHEVKTRTQQGRVMHYITARTAMNRLDDVIGPENWADDYFPFGSNGVKCVLTLVMPDGRAVTKSGIGGITEMHDGSDTDKTGESDALKRAGVKFGVARYLYRNGVPRFAGEVHAPPEPNVRPASEVSTPHRREPVHVHQGANGGPRQGPPRSGKGLFAFVKEAEQKYEVSLLKYLNEFGRLNEFPGRMVDWGPEQVRQAYEEACRKLGASESWEPGANG